MENMGKSGGNRENMGKSGGNWENIGKPNLELLEVALEVWVIAGFAYLLTYGILRAWREM